MNPTDLRADTPGYLETTYLNTGASGPSPTHVVTAQHEFLAFHEYDSPANDGMYPDAFDALDDARATIASHLGANSNDVALTESTTDGMGRIAAAMDWQPDDVVVRTDLEHAAGILPWRALRDRQDVEVRVVPTEHGRVDHDAFADAVDGATLTAFSSLCWGTGTRLDVTALTEIAHDAGARVLVDAVQSPGQHPIDVDEWGADAVAAASHKWLLGPWGAGFLYVDREFAQALAPAQIGYRGVDDPYGDPIELKPDARRFEVGTTQPATYVGAKTAIETIEAIGYDTIQSHVRDLTDHLKTHIPRDDLVSPREYESGLVTFRVDDAAATVDRCIENDIRIRTLPTPGVVRVSLHVVNTREDVDALLDVLDH